MSSARGAPVGSAPELQIFLQLLRGGCFNAGYYRIWRASAALIKVSMRLSSILFLPSTNSTSCSVKCSLGAWNARVWPSYYKRKRIATVSDNKRSASIHGWFLSGVMEFLDWFIGLLLGWLVAEDSLP